MDFQSIYNNMHRASPDQISIDSGFDSLSLTDIKEGDASTSLLVSEEKEPIAIASPLSEKDVYLKTDQGFDKGRVSPSLSSYCGSQVGAKSWRRFRMHEGYALPVEEFRMAVVQGNIPVVKALLAQGIGVDQILRGGWTALMFASSCGQPVIVQFLLQRGADPNMHKEMFTALMAACASSREREEDLLRCVDLLIDFGAKVDACERHRMTPLMFACKEGRPLIVQRLIQAKVDVDKQDNKGWTALCWAATKGHGIVVRKLLESAADPTKMNVHGQRPVDIALSAGHVELADILERATLLDINDESIAVPTTGKSLVPKIATLERTPMTDFGEMEMVLSGLGLLELIPVFQANKITLECFLRLSDNDLEKLGVVAMGTRKKLLEVIALIHKQEWKTTSLPKLSGLPYITLPDAVAMVANINKHLRFIHASVGHLRDQIQATPRILQLGQEKHTVAMLSNSFSDSLKNLSHLEDEVKFFKAHLDKVINNAEFSSADTVLLKREEDRQWQRRLLTTLVVATSVFTATLYFKPRVFAWLFSVTPYPQSSSVFVNIP